MGREGAILLLIFGEPRGELKEFSNGEYDKNGGDSGDEESLSAVTAE